MSQQAMAALEHAAPFLRRELASRLELFRVPELHFEPDVATELGGRMEHLLKRIRRAAPGNEGPIGSPPYLIESTGITAAIA